MNAAVLGSTGIRPLALCAALLLACTAGDDDDDGAAAGSGGTVQATGGMQASGGAQAVSTGGVQATGGAQAVAGSGGMRAGTGGMGGTGGAPPDAGGDASDAGTDAAIDAGVQPPVELSPAFEAAGATDYHPRGSGCVDPPLRVAFSAPPSLGNSGKLEVFDAEQPGAAVATFDMARSSVTDTRGGVSFSMQRQAYIDGRDAVFYLPGGALEYGHSYFVHVSGAAVTGPDGALAIADDTSWTFTTRASAPSDTSALSVSQLGGGDFCTLQGALDAAGAGPSTISIARGTHHGIVYFKSKQRITVRGADRKASVLAGTNNETMNGGTAKRALIGVDQSSEITFENLTIHNLTPQGGSQAEALRMQNCDKCIVRDADVISLQDTLLWSGRVYAENCYIAGNVDFIWGTGTAYFQSCEIKTLGRKGYNVQARNGAGEYGYVFVDSRLTSDPGITGNWLARIDSSVYPASHVAYIDCELGSHIDPAGWQVTGGGTSALRFWEYGSKSPGGTPINTSQRVAGKQITADQAAMMRDKSVVLDGWSP